VRPAGKKKGRERQMNTIMAAATLKKKAGTHMGLIIRGSKLIRAHPTLWRVGGNSQSPTCLSPLAGTGDVGLTTAKGRAQNYWRRNPDLSNHV